MRDQAGGSSGIKVTQLRYDPFADPRRAARQEFGDILAEGLYALLHDPARNVGVSRDYWSYFLAARKRFLDAIIGRLEFAPPQRQSRIFDAVDEARRTLAQIDPDHCEQYLKLWQEDLAIWERKLNILPSLPSITDALDLLGLIPAEPGGPGWPPQVHARPVAEMPGPVVIPSPAMLSGLAAEAALRAQSQSVAMSASGTPGLRRAEAVSRKRVLGPAGLIAGSRARLTSTGGVLGLLTAVQVALGAGAVTPAVRGGHWWKVPADPRRWRRTRPRSTDAHVPPADGHPPACPNLSVAPQV